MGWATSPKTTPLPLTVASFTKAMSNPPLVAKEKQEFNKKIMGLIQRILITFEFWVDDEILNRKDLLFRVGNTSVMLSYDYDKFGFTQVIYTMGSCQD